MRERLTITGPLVPDQAINAASQVVNRAEMRDELQPQVIHHSRAEMSEPRKINPRRPQTRVLAVASAIGTIFSGLGK